LHPRQHGSDVGVVAFCEEADLERRIHLLKDIRLEVGVLMDEIQELLFLFFGAFLDEVRYLGRLESPERSRKVAKAGAADVANQRLELGPVRDVA
jgi:hypothetical protein